MFNWLINTFIKIMNFFQPKSGVRIASNIKASGNVTISGITMTGNGGNMNVSGGKVSLSGRSVTIDDVTINYFDDREEAVKKLTDMGYTGVHIEYTRDSIQVEYNCKTVDGLSINS